MQKSDFSESVWACKPDSRATVDSAAKSFFYLNIFLNFIWPRQPPKRNIFISIHTEVNVFFLLLDQIPT